MDNKILDRYNSPEGAQSYAGKFNRHWTEQVNNWSERRLLARLLRKALNGTSIERALDVPCGYGRLYPIIKNSAGRVVECDWSFHLLKLGLENRHGRAVKGAEAGYVRATALSLPFHDRAFDLVLSVRLCHHIREHAERIEYFREISRVSSRWVIFTYFDEDSLKNRIRRFRRRFNKKRSKWTLTHSEIQAIAEEAGFDLFCSMPLSRLFSGHRYVVLRKKSSISDFREST